MACTHIRSMEAGSLYHEARLFVPQSPALLDLKLFYESKACADLHDKRTDLYLYSDRFIADEFMLEMQCKQ